MATPVSVAHSFQPAQQETAALLHELVLEDTGGGVKSQVEAAVGLGNIINLARPLVRLYAHYVKAQPEFAPCLLRIVQAHPGRAKFASSCTAAAVQYLYMMEALQDFVSQRKTWQPAMQHLFEAMYLTVEEGHFKALMHLFDACLHSRDGESATLDVLQQVQDANMQFVALSKQFIDVLGAPVLSESESGVLSTVMYQFFSLLVYVLLYMSQLVCSILIQLAGRATLDNPEAVTSYKYVLNLIRKLIGKFGREGSVLGMLLNALAPLTMTAHFSAFNLLDPVSFTIHPGGWLYQIVQLLYYWDEQAVNTVEAYIAAPLLASSLGQFLALARTSFEGGAVVAGIGAALKLIMPTTQRALAYVITHTILPIVLPLLASLSGHVASHVIKRVSKYLRLDGWNMQHALSALPASPMPAVVSAQDMTDMLRFLDSVVQENKTGWAYRTLRWFLGVLRRDTKKQKQLVGYKCVPEQQRCVPLLADEPMLHQYKYYLTLARCQQKCKS
jgi:hypothetical protein